MKKVGTLLALLLVLLPAAAGAQHTPTAVGPEYAPNWYRGYVPTPFEWQLLWSNKLDWFPNGLPIALGGTGAVSPAGALNNLGAAPATSGTSVLAGSGAGGFSNVVIGSNLTFSGLTLAAPTMTTTVGGAVPTPPNDTTKFLNGAGAFTSPIGTTYTNGTGLSLTGTVFSLTAPVTVALGGTNCVAASGTCLDNITGFASTGFITRTGAGAYSFQSATNGITRANLAQGTANTLVGNSSGSTANVADVSVPSCSGSTNALNWTSGTGFGCPTFGTAALAATGTSGATVPLLNGANTWSGVQSFNDGDFGLKGSTSGTTTVKATAIAGSTVITLPAVTDTVMTIGTTNQAFTGGVLPTTVNLGTVSSGTTTIACGSGPQQQLTNNGAFTLAAPAADSNCFVKVTNGASAGAITFSGFSVPSSTGDPLDTTNGHKFVVTVVRIGGDSTYRIAAFQ